MRIVTDNHKTNVALFKKLCEGQVKTKISHPLNNPALPLFFSFDYCHIVKNARSIFLDRDMVSSASTITVKFL